jgi:hypothetical protein
MPGSSPFAGRWCPDDNEGRHQKHAALDFCFVYGLVKDHSEYWSQDGVHFNGKGIAAQAEQVSKRILDSLK